MPPLNLDETQILEVGTHLLRLLQSLERSSSERSVVPRLDRSALANLRHQPFLDQGIGIDQLFSEISETVVPNSTNTAHPRFLAYVLGPPNGVAPFAEAIAAALNQNCNFWQLSPAANAIEQSVVSWLASLFNYPDTAGGLMTSGGSLATLTALSAAMHARVPDLRRTGIPGRSAPLVLYTSAEAHRCVDKNAAILGLGTDNVRKVAVDSAFRMRLDRLSDALDATGVPERSPSASSRRLERSTLAPSTRLRRWPTSVSIIACGCTWTLPTEGSSSSAIAFGTSFWRASEPIRSPSIRISCSSLPSKRAHSL